MLDPSWLEDEIKNAIETSFKPALKNAMITTFSSYTETSEKQAEKFAETATSALENTFSKAMANIIDTYIKQASIYMQGTIITTGSPSVQQAQILVDSEQQPLYDLKGTPGVPNIFTAKIY